jgi:hypothetical protein
MIFKITALALGLAALLPLAACTSSSDSSPNDTTTAAASAEASNAGAGLNLIFTNQPAPVFPTSAWRMQLIEVEAVEALGSPTTAFLMPPGWNGSGSHPFKVCPAEGLPIPNTAQLDNPDEIVQDPYGGGYKLNQGGLVKPQADPNGVYTPASSSGTYIACLNASGGLRAAYWEGDVFAETGSAVWDSTAGMVRDIGPSQLPQCTVETAHAGDGSGVPAKTSYYHCVKAPSTAAWTLPGRDASGRIVTTAYTSSAPLVISCTMHDGTLLHNGKETRVHGIESTCGFPGDLQLTFAPWGIVKFIR